MKAIVIVHGGSIGDVLLAVPALRALGLRFRGARLHLVSRPSVGKLLVESGVVDECSELESPRFLPLFADQDTVPDELCRWASAFEVGLVWLRRGQDVAGRLKQAGVSRVLARSPYPDEIGSVHTSGHLLKTLGALGIMPAREPIRLTPYPQVREFACRLFRKAELAGEAPVVAIHPGSGSVKKNWPAERFAQVADWVADRLSGKVLLIVGPADYVAVRQMISNMRSAPAVVLRRESLGELAAVLVRSDVYLGNDSGITHLASLVGTRTVALFGPTDPRVWAPVGEHVTVISSPVSCAPCSRLMRWGCEKPACLDAITLEMVIGALEEALSR